MANGHYSSSYNNNNNNQPLPMHLCFFLLILLMFVGFSWYINYKTVLDNVFDQVKLVLMFSPLLLLLVVHWLSNWDQHWRLSYYIPFPEKDSLHKAGGTPWGVGFLVVFLFFMISYQASLQERWFPLLSR